MLAVQDLTVSVITGYEPLKITRNVSFDIAEGEILGVVGESGCGKSMTSLAIMGLLPSKQIKFNLAECFLAVPISRT